MEKEDRFLLDLESEEAVNAEEIAVLPSTPAEPEAKVPTLHSSMEEEQQSQLCHRQNSSRTMTAQRLNQYYLR